MSYKSRIPADPDYLLSVGRAFYNFTYLEWIVMWTIAKLSADGFKSVPRGETASRIAKALSGAINATTPPLPDSLKSDLVEFHRRFLNAIKKRNKLLHAHPYTTASGAQQLSTREQRWSVESVDDAAQFFENAALFGNGVFHGSLKKERP